MQMKKVFALSLISVALLAAGCSDDDDNDTGGTTGTDTGTTTGGTGTDTGTTTGTATGGELEYPAYTIEGDSVVDAIVNNEGTGATGTSELATLITERPDLAAQLDYEGMADGEEGATTAAEGETTAAEGETTAAEGETTAAEGETTAAEGETTAAEGETTAAEGVTTGGDTGGMDDAAAPEVVDYTIFAPSDDAIAAADLPGLNLSMDQITDVLANHVVSGESVLSTDITAGDTYPALSGQTLTLEAGETEGTFTVSNGEGGTTATITMTDLVASNGVVHIIDMVLVGGPPPAGTTGGDTGTDGATGADTGAATGGDTGAATGGDTGGDDGGAPVNNGGANESALANDPTYSEFTQAFRSTLGGPSLDDPANTWTVFAAANDGFDGEGFDVAQAQNYVVVGEKLTPDQLGSRQMIQVNSGTNYTVAMDGTQITVNGAPVTVISEAGTSIVYGIAGTLD